MYIFIIVIIVNLIAVFCLIKIYSNLVSLVLQFIRRYFISKLMNIIIAFYRFKAKYSY